MNPPLSLEGALSELARRDLVTFSKRVLPSWEPALHLTYIAGLLQKLEQTRGRLIISLPVRHGKSVLASQIFSAWYLGRHPSHSIILASYSDALATSHARIAKHIIEGDRYPFPGVKLSQDSTSVQRFNLEQGGGLRALGTGAGISGYGADVLIGDDLLHDGLSQSEKDACWQWWQQVAVGRLNPGGKILLIGARLAPDDLIGRLLESEDADLYEYVRIPAIAEDDDILGRAKGEALWPERMGLAELEERRVAMGSNAFAAQFMQEALPSSGRIFDLSWFGTYERMPEPQAPVYNPLDRYYANPLSAARRPADDFLTLTSVDAAAKQTDSGSYSAIVTLVTDGQNIYVAEVERMRVDFPELRRRTIAHCARWNSRTIVIEEAAFGSRLIGDLKASSSLSVLTADPFGRSKEERAIHVLPLIESGRVFLPVRALWLEDFRREIASFPGRFTDQTDALCWGLAYIFRLQRVLKENAAFDRQMESFSLFR
jgi:predicted phage terminase large subunit-like protein